MLTAMISNQPRKTTIESQFNVATMNKSHKKSDRIMRTASFVIVCVTCLVGLAQADCPLGDLTGDCQVDVADMQILAEQWLAEPHALVNLNGDARIDFVDLAMLAGHWHETGCPIVINELLAHSHDNAPDWIELHNAGSLTVNIGGWFLSDDKNDLYKYRIADSTVVEPNGYIVFYENQHFSNPADSGALSPFALSENQETLYLNSANDDLFPQYLAEESLGASETWISFGRYRKSTGDYDFTLESELTPGHANAYPLVGPVVINEIMYHPDLVAGAEYIELLNISDASVTLYDADAAEPWRLMDPNLWFPKNPPATLQPGEYLVLVKDLSAFNSSYAVPLGVQVLEWSSGKLANGNDNIWLAKPGDIDDQGIRYWIQVDTVSYSDGSHSDRFPGISDPWPVEPDGLGSSLSRRLSDHYSNDPNNWKAAIPSPGLPNR
jgi:hypothetical protein